MNTALKTSAEMQAALASDPNVQWVAAFLDRELTLPEQALVWVLCAGRWNAYHIDGTWQRLKEWGNGVAVNFEPGNGLATYDSSELTSIVIAAHDIGARVSISPCSPRHLRIVLHLKGRDNEMWERHPTLEQAIVRLRKPLLEA